MIRLWALSDFTCLKTLEGHANSVLQIVFVSRGMQLLSSDSDGLIKLWTIKTSECVKTLDEHADKVWSLALSNSQEIMLTGGVDSVLNIWKDVTEEEEETARMAVEDQLMKEQELSNLLQRKQFTKAISLALTLEQPLRTLNVIKDILFEEQGEEELARTLKDLRDDQIDVLLKFLCDWNTNAKHSRVSQLVLSLILKQHSPTWLTERPEIKERIEALLPYTERHMERMNRLLQQSMFLEYTWQSMKLAISTDANENTFAGDILYQKSNIQTPGSVSWPGRLKYLTYINENLQSLYFLLAFVGDVYLLLKTKSKKKENDSGIIKLQDFMFAVIVFPLGMLVCFVFWSIYAVDRELIYPEILDNIIPKLCNHIMHTAVAIFLVLEAFLVHHKFPSTGISLPAGLLFSLSYFLWMVYQKHFLSEWPYPFLDEFTIFHHVVFVLVCFAFQCAFYFLGKYFTNLRQKIVAPEKLKRKAK
ncbi:Transducin beta 3 [Paramuricea clavata]|uniref:Transducin beta 3 n=1 Tax=Paramuricea clavata TaxID=317549 RepID=A0A6S7I0U4_PARCT|nr:Transducin beta 3 [Paramuricea clavata]